MQAPLAISNDLDFTPSSPTLLQTAARIDPVAYHEVALALLATDVPIGHVRRLGLAIREARDEDSYRHFMGEYADLASESIRQDLNQRRSEVQ
jgi:hypothetical protein